MITHLRDGKKMIPLKSGTTLLIGLRGELPSAYLCNTGECPIETNDTVILGPEEIDDVIITLSGFKNEILTKMRLIA